MSGTLVGYARLSKSNAAGHGLDVQRQAIEDYCSRHGFSLLRIESDDGASGGSTKGRHGFSSALDACRTGEADGVIAAKLDRLTRSLLDFASLVEDAQRHRYAVIAIDQAFDLRTPSGEAMAGMLAVFAQWERRTISARTRDALKVAKGKGTKLGRPKGTPSHFKTPADVEARIQGMSAEGLSLRLIASTLNGGGVATTRGGQWSAESVRQVLKRA
jgi:DNA invertase Pin-like site-specific DNA recombinase